jgi:hypothetical protein
METNTTASPKFLSNRVETMERLVALFRLERLVLLGVTAVSFLILFAVALRMLMEDTPQIAGALAHLRAAAGG